MGKQITFTFYFFTWSVMGKQNNTGVPGFFGCSDVPGSSGVFRCSRVFQCSRVFWCSRVFQCSGVPGFSTSQKYLSTLSEFTSYRRLLCPYFHSDYFKKKFIRSPPTCTLESSDCYFRTYSWNPWFVLCDNFACSFPVAQPHNKRMAVFQVIDHDHNHCTSMNSFWTSLFEMVQINCML